MLTEHECTEISQDVLNTYGMSDSCPLKCLMNVILESEHLVQCAVSTTGVHCFKMADFENIALHYNCT